VSGGRYWEEFRVGEEMLAGSRVVTGADVDAFAALSGDRNPLHGSDEAARAAGFEGGRIAHGVLGLAVATGILNRSGLTAGTLVAFVGVEWAFQLPLYPGTQVTLRLRVCECRATRHRERGLVVFAAGLADEAGALLQSGELKFLVRRLPA
jgi:acyl dehydratase